MDKQQNITRGYSPESIMEYLQSVNKVIHQIYGVQYAIDLIKSAKRVYVFGNGGSAATSSHFVVDLQKMANVKAYCLNDNIPSITAYANDVSYETIFSHQVDRLVTKNDAVIGISCSGNSENVIQGILVAKSKGALTIGITGYGGGELGTVVDFHLNVPINNMQICEDCHLIITHLISYFYDK